MTTPPHTVDFDSTVEALDQDVRSLNPSAALGLIDGWQQRLQQSGESDLQPIAADLGELQRLLTGNPLDGKAIGAVLQRLGAATIAANQSGRHGVSSIVQRLGQRLQQLGDTLTGAAS
jgi:hypothetical protein